MDALTDIEIKADDDHDSAVSSPLQQLDSSASSPLQRVESVAGSPSEDRADSLEYSTDDVSAIAVHANPMQIYTLHDFSIANGLLGIGKVINDGNRSITSIEDENTYQTWHDKDRARDLFESSGSSLNTSLSSDNHQLSKNSRDLSFTPSRGSHVKLVPDATTPVSPISEPSGVDHAYRLPRPLLMFSPGLSPIHSKAYVRSQDDRRGRAASVAVAEEDDDDEGVEVQSIPSRPLSRSMISKDGLIIIPVSSSVDGNAPDTPISNFWRNRFFGNDAKDRRSYRSFDSSSSTSKQHPYSEVLRMPLLDDLPDTINSSPSSADESFNTADTDLQLDRQSLIYPTTHSLYQASNHNNSTSSIDGRDIASMKPAMIRAVHRQDESISTVDTDLRIDQKSLVYPTTPSLYKASSRHSNNSSTASSIVNDKDYPLPSRSVSVEIKINRMPYNSDVNDCSFVSADSDFKIGNGSFSVHPASTATAHLDASQMQNDSSFGTGDHEDSVTKQSLIYYRSQYEAEDSASAANYSDLNATKISFLVPSTDLQHSNYGDFFTLNTDNDDPHYSGSRDVTDESLLRSMSYLPEKRGDRPPAAAAAPQYRSDRPPVTHFSSSQPSRNIAASASRSSRGNYFSDSEVMKDSTSHRGGGGLLKAAPTRQAAEAVSLVHRTTISRPARSFPIPPIASPSNKMKTPTSKEDYRPHNFTTPVSPHNDVHGRSDTPPSAHQTKGRESSSSPSWYSEAPPSLLPIGSLYTLLSDSSGRPIFVPVMQSPPSGLEDSSMLLQGAIKGKGIIAEESFPSAPRMEGFSPHADPSLLNRFYYAADDDPWMHRRTDAHGSAGGKSRSSRSHPPSAEDRHYLARVLEKALNSSSAGSPTDHHHHDHHRSDDHNFSARRVPPSPVISSTSGTPRSKSPYRLGMSIDGRECLLPSSAYWKDRMAHRSMTSVVNSAAFLRMIT